MADAVSVGAVPSDSLCVNKSKSKFELIQSLDLKCEYGIVFEKDKADKILKSLKANIQYMSRDESKITVRGHSYHIPRQVVNIFCK